MNPPEPHARPLVVAGASVRALAASAARAGWEVHAADLFADLDLLDVATRAVRVRPYPEGLPAAVAAFPPGPWLYAGALENHPDVIAEISRDRPLAGCDPAAVVAVRDPGSLARAVRGLGLHFPDTRPTPDGIPGDGSWLVKPLRSAGGHGILDWRGGDVGPAGSSGRIWQRRVSGRPWSASYLLAGGAGTLLGLSRQFVGRRWCRARPYAFCGCVEFAPDALGADVADRLHAFGDLLAAHFGLTGLVGVDLILGQGHVHVLEVNPRPTASMELLERATGLCLAAAHMTACGFPTAVVTVARPRRGTWSKAILYADGVIEIDDEAVAAFRAAARETHAGWPLLADIPAAPQTIPAGGPVCTIFAHGGSPRESLAALRRRIRRFSRPTAARPEGRPPETASGTRPRWSPDRSP